MNLEAIYYGLASDEHTRRILDWIAGDRVVEGDTSTGEDIYHFRFAPRASTLRNTTWYFWAWPGIEKPWGGQVQDGGAVLGFAYHDLMARLKNRGADDAAKRMDEMLKWLAETQAEGGFHAYYAADPSRGTMQGGGPDGGLGIDIEFIETELWPSVLLSGFAGFRPTAEGFTFDPKQPAAWPSLTIRNVAFRDSVLTVTVTKDEAKISVQGDSVGRLVMSSDQWLPAVADAKPAGEVQLVDGATLTFKRK